MKKNNVIFEDPPEDINETWTHGAILGGMIWFDDDSLARSYFLAGETLVDNVLSEGGERGQDLISPILYVYRHGIELYLKVITQPKKKNHSLGSLLEAFCNHIRSKYNENVPKWITIPVSRLAKYDPESDLFRYGQTMKIDRTKKIISEGEYWIDLSKLKQTMKRIEHSFIRVIVADTEGIEGLKYMRPHIE